MFKNSLLFSLLFSYLRFGVDGGDPAGGGGGGSGNPPANPPRQEPETFSRQYVHELREESKTWRTKATDLEKAHKDAVDRVAALERENGEKLTAAEQRANERVIRAELKAAAVKHGLVDLDGIKLLDLSSIKLNEDGTVEGADALFEAAKKAKPYLFGDSNSSSHAGDPPPPSKGEPKQAKDMTREEYKTARAAAVRAGRR